MPQLTSVELEDGTIVYMEVTENVDVSEAVVTEEQGRVKRDGTAKVIQSFEAIKGTIAAYTNYTLNAFQQVAIANVDKVTLEFGVTVGGEAGVPYVTKGTASSNIKIVEIYRPGRDVEVLDRPLSLSGEDVLPGFILDLT